MYTYKFIINWSLYYEDADNIKQLKLIIKEKLWICKIEITNRYKNYIPNWF